jgi:hypothetical protein
VIWQSAETGGQLLYQAKHGGRNQVCGGMLGMQQGDLPTTLAGV